MTATRSDSGALKVSTDDRYHAGQDRPKALIEMR